MRRLSCGDDPEYFLIVFLPYRMNDQENHNPIDKPQALPSFLKFVFVRYAKRMRILEDFLGPLEAEQVFFLISSVFLLIPLKSHDACNTYLCIQIDTRISYTHKCVFTMEY
jgi:hypothetical protein